MNNFKIIFLSILILLTTGVCFAEIDKKKADQVAGKTLEIFTNINMILNRVTKPEHITKDVKSSLKKHIHELKKLKAEINKIRNESPKNVKVLNEQFKKGSFSEALQKTVKIFFQNVKRIKKLNGGDELVKIIVV